MKLPQRYPYNPRWQIIFACAAFFCICSAFMAYKAIHNSTGLIIGDMITLGPAGATVFYWIIASLCGMFVLVSLLLAIRRIVSHQILELGVDELFLPYGFFQTKILRIPYSEIQSVLEVQASGQTLLYIIVNGRRFTITASLLSDTNAYISVRDFLMRMQHVDATKGN